MRPLIYQKSSTTRIRSSIVMCTTESNALPTGSKRDNLFKFSFISV